MAGPFRDDNAAVEAAVLQEAILDVERENLERAKNSKRARTVQAVWAIVVASLVVLIAAGSYWGGCLYIAPRGR